jgi:myo-inositol-1(or 4)-monophosphatase
MPVARLIAHGPPPMQTDFPLSMTAEPDWTELTAFARALAGEAALHILPYFRADTPVDVKPGEVWDPVTEADRAGERAMRAMIEARFPDHGIHGEEYGVKPAHSGFTWILDPVDGTRAFICGMPTWATLIGLNLDGIPKVGVMAQPHIGETFYGSAGGAWLDYRGSERPIRVRTGRRIGEATLTTTAPELYRTPEEKAVLKRLSAAARMTRYGGDAYFFCVLAAGQTDLAMDARMAPYDIAPLIPIIEGAGGHVCTWERGDAAKGGNVIAAGSREVLDEALVVIAG